MTTSISKKKLKYILYLIIIVLFCGYLKFSNYIFAMMAGSTLSRENFETYQVCTATGNAYIDSFTIGEDLFQVSTISGWAFCETEEANQTRNSKFLFVSKENTYSLDATLSERGDVKSAFLAVLPENSSIKLGVMGSFSPITMEEGIYDLYIYCWENEQDYGLVNTGMTFIKEGRTFKQYVFQSKETDSLTADHAVANSSVDIVSQTNSNLEITGWAICEGGDCSQQEVYIQLSNEMDSKTYTTESKIRSDVAASYKNEQYLQCGYMARIPMEQLAAGSYCVEIFVKYGEQIASMAKGTLCIEGDGTVAYDNGEIGGAAFSSQETEKLTADEKLRYYAVDVVSVVESNVNITGWSFLENMDCSQQKVYVELTNGAGSRVYTTQQMGRPDVADAYKNELYAQSGYTASIPFERLEAGQYDMEIFVKNGERIASVPAGTIQLLEDNTVSYLK